MLRLPEECCPVQGVPVGVGRKVAEADVDRTEQDRDLGTEQAVGECLHGREAVKWATNVREPKEAVDYGVIARTEEDRGGWWWLLRVRP